MNALLKTGKWYWVIMFAAISILEIIIGFKDDHPLRWIYKSHIPLMMFIILLMFYRNWLSWLFMICVCLYGLYNLFTWALIASSPTTMDFGYWPRVSMLKHNQRRFIQYLTAPEFFYFFTLIFFITTPVRKKYFNSNVS